MNKFLFTCLLSISLQATAQLPDTDIFLADIKNNHGKISIGSPVNMTNRKGYDNQPYFTPDGKKLLFVSIKDTIHGADIYSYRLDSKLTEQLTNTLESEYSPSYSPDGRSISIVRVDSDGGQRFYNLPLKKISDAQLVKGTDSIGYYCRLNDSLLAMFVLGDAQTLQVLNMNTHEKKLIASDIGRCLKLSNDKKQLFFVLKQNKEEWSIFSMNISSFNMTKVVSTLKDNEDYALMPDGTFLMGSEGKLFKYKPDFDKEWNEVADFSSTLKSFYRISVNVKGDKIALVVYTGKKP